MTIGNRRLFAFIVLECANTVRQVSDFASKIFQAAAIYL